MTTPQDPFAAPSGGQPDPPPPYGAPTGPPAPGQQPYGAPPYGTARDGQHGGPARNGLGVAALVLGILGLLTFWLVIGGVLGLVAVVLGVLGRGRAKRGEATNGGMALAGIITGAIAVVVTVLYVAGIASLFGGGEFANLTDCLEQAGGDQAAVDACSREFEDSVTSG